MKACAFSQTEHPCVFADGARDVAGESSVNYMIS